MAHVFLSNFEVNLSYSLSLLRKMAIFRKKKQYIPTLDDIVFEKRNKGYGCYYLRATYERRLRFSFLLVLGLFILTTLIFFFWEINPFNHKLDTFDNTTFESVEYNPEIIPSIIHLPFVPQEKQVTLTKLSDQKNIIEKTDKSSNRVEVPIGKYKPVLTITDTSYKNLAEELLRRHKTILSNEASSDSIIIILEKGPEFPGGYSALQSYFFKNQRYPENALLTGIQGSTIVSFIVNEKGVVEDPMVVSGIDPELDQEAIRLVKTMPVWRPAYYKGKPIACKLVMPVDFKLR
jgi:periplasmic protein TonB